MAVTNVAELNALVERVKKAQREYASFAQEQVDKIFRAAALAAEDAESHPRKWPLPNPAWVSSKIK
ncbi:hypothetical protein ACLK1U_07150 [Escherichia coli]